MYPEVNRIENLLRRYLTKFFIQRVGLEWWEATATKSMVDKVMIRKSDRKDEFSQIADTDVSLADFDDLGELIYKQSSGFNNPEKVVGKIVSIKSIEELQSFQTELQGNYTKYFKEYFKDKGFESQWKEIFKIRNKVAHQGIFYKAELDRGMELSKSLSEIILDAENNIDEIVFSIEEKEAIRNATIEAVTDDKITKKEEDEENNVKQNVRGLKILGKIELPEYRRRKLIYQAIEESELLEELDNCLKTNSYVGLKWFVTDHLAALNFSIGLSYSLVNILVDKGKIEIYDITDGEYPIKALRKK